MKDKQRTETMIIDTHAHYDNEAFDMDRDVLLSGLPSRGIELVVNIGASIETTKETLKLTERYPFVWGVVGVHPSETTKMEEAHIDWLREAARRPKTVAIGEIGLDYYWDEPDREIQKHWFMRQLDLARETGLPVVIHSRDAAKDTLDIMKGQRAGDMGGVIHCFSYGVELAREYLDMGHYLGIGGVLTFENARKLKEVVAYMPMERMVLETDCPYLSPEPFRGKRNSSLNLPWVVRAVSAIKGISEEEVISITSDNARAMYRMHL